MTWTCCFFPLWLVMTAHCSGRGEPERRRYREIISCWSRILLLLLLPLLLLLLLVLFLLLLGWAKAFSGGITSQMAGGIIEYIKKSQHRRREERSRKRLGNGSSQISNLRIPNCYFGKIQWLRKKEGFKEREGEVVVLRQNDITSSSEQVFCPSFHAVCCRGSSGACSRVVVVAVVVVGDPATSFSSSLCPHFL